MTKKQPRGLRNNNPGNLRRSTRTWRGKVTTGGDPAFETFVSMAYGYRALMVTLRTYITTHRLNTVKDIIYRWAPPIENHTEDYIHRVCSETGYTRTQILKADRLTLIKLAAAISRVENGIPAVLSDVEAGWALM